MTHNGLLLLNNRVSECLIDLDGENTSLKFGKSLPEDFYFRFYNNDEILPKNCIYSEKNGTTQFVIIEEPPQYRTISIKSNVLMYEIDYLTKNKKLKTLEIDKWLSENEKRISDNYSNTQFYRLNIYFPYTIFIMSFVMSKTERKYSRRSMSFWYRVKPITSLNDLLIIPNLPNLNNSHACSPSPPPTNSLKLQVDQSVNFFWNSLFSEDWVGQYYNYIDKDMSLSSLLYWQIVSKSNPSSVFKEKWNYDSKNIYNHLLDIKNSMAMYRIKFPSSYLVNNNICFNEFLLKDFKNGNYKNINSGEVVEIDKKKYIIQYFSENNINKSEDPICEIFLKSCDDGNEVKFQLTEELIKYLIENKLNDSTSYNIGNKVLKKLSLVKYLIDGKEEINFIIDIRKNPLDVYEIKFINSIFKMINKEFVDTFEVIGNLFDNNLILERNFNNMNLKQIFNFKDIKYNDYYNKISVLLSTENIINLDSIKDYQINSSDKYEDNLQKFSIIESKCKIYVNNEDLEKCGFEFYSNNDNNLISKVDSSENGVRNFLKAYDFEKVFDMLCNEIIHKDGIRVKSLESDIDLKYGDKVCHFKTMGDFKITTFKSIKIDKDIKSISLILEDDVEIRDYIKINIYNTENTIKSLFSPIVIKKILVKKLETSCGDLSSQYKVVSKVSGISGFPKNAVNLIEGFILNDDNRVSILMSNGASVYFDEYFYSLFDVIKIDNKKYNSEKYQTSFKPYIVKPIIGDYIFINEHILEIINITNNNNYECNLIHQPSLLYSYALSRSYNNRVEGYTKPRFENKDIINS